VLFTINGLSIPNYGFQHEGNFTWLERVRLGVSQSYASVLQHAHSDDSTGLDHSSTGSFHLSASTQLQPIPHSPDSPPDMNTSDHSGCNQPDTPDPSSATIHHQFSSHSMETQPTPAAPMFPFSRPYSIPDGHMSMQPANWIDGGSATSLPLPLQTPYNLLPRMDGSASPSSNDSQTPSEAPGGDRCPCHPKLMQHLMIRNFMSRLCPMYPVPRRQVGHVHPSHPRLLRPIQPIFPRIPKCTHLLYQGHLLIQARILLPRRL
jgi:hypothetical protein